MEDTLTRRPGFRREFTLSDSELVTLVSPEDLESGKPMQAIYSKDTAFVFKHKSNFDTLWNITIPASNRIKELEEKQIRSLK